jgi:hypothetical protein
MSANRGQLHRELCVIIRREPVPSQELHLSTIQWPREPVFDVVAPVTGEDLLTRRLPRRLARGYGVPVCRHDGAGVRGLRVVDRMVLDVFG